MYGKATSHDNTLLNAALDYATNPQRPLKVFPAPPGEKKSRVSGKRANDGAAWGMTSDPEQIKKYWRKWPDSNIGLPTGAINGIFVVEVDTKEGHAKLTVEGQQSLDKLIADHGNEWPETRTARSPSGSRHYYFTHPLDRIIKNSTSGLGEGIDVRGDGGMVIAPPSINPKYPDRRYEFENPEQGIVSAPTWLLDLVCETPSTNQQSGEPLAPIEKLAAAMAIIPNDHAGVKWEHADAKTGEVKQKTGWDGWNEIGMALYRASGGSDEGFAIFDKWSAQNRDKYDADTTRERWYKNFASSPPDRIGAGTIFMLANAVEPGWQQIWEQEYGEQPEFLPDTETGDGNDSGTVQPTKITKPRWRLSGNGIAKSMHNARLALTALGIECSHDVFHDKILLGLRGDNFRHQLETFVGEVNDHVIIRLRQTISDVFGFDPNGNATRDGVVSLAQEHRFNPVADMLDQAEAQWDGVNRLDRAAVDYFSAADTPLNLAFVRLTLIAAVRRVRQPGCKFDTILVLESPEGWNKSTVWRLLAGDENFSDANILGKNCREVQEGLAEVWIHENAELAGIKKAEVEMIKSFASRQIDTARPAYAHFQKRQPRHSIEVGTTNAENYLLSQTGNRRFWPMKLLKEIDLEKVRRDRMQLWGEASARERQGESITLDKSLWDAAAIEQEKRRTVDPWEDILRMMPESVEDRGYRMHQIIHRDTDVHGKDIEKVESSALLTYVLEIEPGRQGRHHFMQLSDAMKKLGWQRHDNGKLSIKGLGQVRGYWRQASEEFVLKAAEAEAKAAEAEAANAEDAAQWAEKSAAAMPDAWDFSARKEKAAEKRAEANELRAKANELRAKVDALHPKSILNSRP
jgi:predicted P-loop ATPase